MKIMIIIFNEVIYYAFIKLKYETLLNESSPILLNQCDVAIYVLLYRIKYYDI